MHPLPELVDVIGADFVEIDNTGEAAGAIADNA
jgi:hypothetical protein